MVSSGDVQIIQIVKALVTVWEGLKKIELKKKEKTMNMTIKMKLTDSHSRGQDKILNFIIKLKQYFCIHEWLFKSNPYWVWSECSKCLKETKGWMR